MNSWTQEQMHVFAVVKTPEMAVLLIEHGVELELRDANGHTALMAAVLMGRHEVAEWLVERKADLSTVSGQMTVLDLAAIQGDSGMVQKLLKAGAAPYQRYPQHSTLGYAITGKHLEVVKILLAEGTDVDWHAWQMARSSGDKQIERLIYASCMKGPHRLSCT